MAIHYPDEFDLDVRLTYPSPGELGYARPVVEMMAETDATCFSTCSGANCDTSDTCFSTCSPCQTVDAHTCVGDCTNNCPGPANTDHCPQTQATCGGHECSTNFSTCQGATCQETGGCSTCAVTCVGDTCPGSTCPGSTCDC